MKLASPIENSGRSRGRSPRVLVPLGVTKRLGGGAAWHHRPLGRVGEQGSRCESHRAWCVMGGVPGGRPLFASVLAAVSQQARTRPGERKREQNGEKERERESSWSERGARLG